MFFNFLYFLTSESKKLFEDNRLHQTSLNIVKLCYTSIVTFAQHTTRGSHKTSQERNWYFENKGQSLPSNHPTKPLMNAIGCPVLPSSTLSNSAARQEMKSLQQFLVTDHRHCTSRFRQQTTSTFSRMLWHSILALISSAMNFLCHRLDSLRFIPISGQHRTSLTGGFTVRFNPKSGCSADIPS